MNIQRTHWRAAILVLLLLTFSIRIHALDAVPPGLTHDEASNGHDGAAILDGVHRIYFPVGYGHEPLYNYSVAVATFFLGQSIFTLRITTVLWSLLTWLCTVALARRWWGRGAGLFTSAALAAGFWPLMMARVGLRAPALPALLAASALAYDHAITTKSQAAKTSSRAWAGYALAGLFLGASLYTYMASRGMPLLFLTFLIGLALTDRTLLRKSWRGTLAALIIAGLVSYPLFRYLALHPELEQRITQLGGAITALRAGDPRPLWASVTGSLPMLFWKADPLWLYNVAGRPALEPVLALAFFAGTGRALARLRDRRSIFVLIWLGGGLAPAFLTSVEHNSFRAIAALPAIFLLTGLGFDTVLRFARRVTSSKLRGKSEELRMASSASRFTFHISRFITQPLRFTFYVLLLLLASTLLEASRAYFITWGQNRDVRVLYHHHVVETGRHLDASDDATPVIVTSIYPGEFHDPYTMEVTLRRDDLDLRWSDGRGALFFPRANAHGVARLYTESQSSPSSTLNAIIEPYLTPETTLTFRPDDLPDTVRGYVWDADASWNMLIADLESSVLVAPGDPPPSAAHRPTPLPITYGGSVSLIGYRATPDAPQPGSIIELLTAWEVQAAHLPDTSLHELVLFTHLIDDTGAPITQVDRLDAPSWQWQPGDRFAHVHTLILPAEIPPGHYHLAVGLYTRTDVIRLTVNVNPGPVTRVLIPLEVQAP